MIELTRALARRFRTVLRRSLPERDPRRSWPPVVCRAGDDGLTLYALQADMALRYHLPGKRPPDGIAFHAAVLAAFEGRTEAPVTLEQVAAGKGRARWDDGGAPRSLEFDAARPEDEAEFPEAPARLVAMPDHFLPALDEAARTAARESTRFSLSHVCLRGSRGEVVATDGRQLLVQGGFSFPWEDDVLIPRVSAFGCREFAEGGEVALGRAKSHVAVRSGPWTLLLAVDTTGRYPEVDAVVPRAVGATSRLRLDPKDAAWLVAALPKLPGAEFRAPLTLDLAAPPAVRARADGSEQVSELVLVRSTMVGPPVRLCMNRDLLHRAVKLGFTELQVFGADKPVLCRDDRRLYLWVPLDKNAAIPPSADALRVAPPEGGGSALSTPTDQKEKRPMPTPPPNGRATDGGRTPDPQPEHWGIDEVIAESEALRGVLQDASARVARLLAALKHQRRQSRAVRAAMASLQQLKLDP